MTRRQSVMRGIHRTAVWDGLKATVAQGLYGKVPARSDCYGGEGPRVDPKADGWDLTAREGHDLSVGEQRPERVDQTQSMHRPPMMERSVW